MVRNPRYKIFLSQTFDDFHLGQRGTVVVRRRTLRGQEEEIVNCSVTFLFIIFIWMSSCLNSLLSLFLCFKLTSLPVKVHLKNVSTCLAVSPFGTKYHLGGVGQSHKKDDMKQ